MAAGTSQVPYYVPNTMLVWSPHAASIIILCIAFIIILCIAFILYLFRYVVIFCTVAGAYEPPKEHETFIACWVPSQSKSIAKYLPYKESNVLLFVTIYKAIFKFQM